MANDDQEIVINIVRQHSDKFVLHVVLWGTLFTEFKCPGTPDPKPTSGSSWWGRRQQQSVA